MSQTIDVSAGYAPCRQAADGSPHTTHFVHATGHLTNDITSTMYPLRGSKPGPAMLLAPLTSPPFEPLCERFGKVYQI